jgi:hypothetical protein
MLAQRHVGSVHRTYLQGARGCAGELAGHIHQNSGFRAPDLPASSDQPVEEREARLTGTALTWYIRIGLGEPRKTWPWFGYGNAQSFITNLDAPSAAARTGRVHTRPLPNKVGSRAGRARQELSTELGETPIGNHGQRSIKLQHGRLEG